MPVSVASVPDVPLTERLDNFPHPCTPSEVARALEPSSGGLDSRAVAAPARAYQEFRHCRGAGIVLRSTSERGGDADPFGALHRQDPEAALRLANVTVTLPVAGDLFAGFKLLRELGRGAFGRVFVAEQPVLANRQVVLKISADVHTEAHSLARLLHTNIVPVYSVHRSGPLQAVCMPYCGSTTLADAIRRFRGDTLPDSGKGLVTLLNSSVLPGRADVATAPDSLVLAPHPSSTVILDLLGRLSYVDAVLWLGARLADALAHAHDQGIVHRDLKPANVLLTDEGQPMLLDFNLATDTTLSGLAEVARLGGTLPYMPPEHLESFAGQPRVVDARGDLYALGVILFELLTGRHPFPPYRSATPELLRKMVDDRRHAPRLRDKNRSVSPAVESIVRKCLEPDPANRYPSAHALQEDLERQLQHRPLRHAPDRSPRERLRKWARRHPRLSSTAFLGTCAGFLLAATAGLAVYQHERRLGLEARESFGAFREDSRRFQISLTGLPDDDRRSLAEALVNGRQVLDRYPAPDDPSWQASVRHLAETDRQQLREEIGVILLMLAHATAKGADDPATLATALRLNEQAAGCFLDGIVPSTIMSQRAELLDRLGRKDDAADTRANAGAPPTSARDLYLAGWDHARNGRYAPAVPLLEEATQRDPQALWAWFLLGRCHDGLSHDADAIACYDACLALQPDAHQVWHNRGLAQLRRGEFARARADFDRALELRPGLADAYFNRALAKRAMRDLPEAEADLTKALEHGSAYTRVYFVRSEVRAKLGNKTGAEEDRKAGLTKEPVEESCWTARGLARIRTEPAAALADFDRALERNPQYRPALVNKAHVLAEVMNRTADAVVVLDQAIKHHPANASLRAARAVYLARLGQRAGAHQGAEEALQLSGDPATRYQVAGVYALTSKTHPEDQREAFRLLAMALKKDYGFEHLDSDPELAPVRHLPEFKELVSAARALRSDRR